MGKRKRSDKEDDIVEKVLKKVKKLVQTRRRRILSSSSSSSEDSFREDISLSPTHSNCQNLEDQVSDQEVQGKRVPVIIE